MLSAHVEPFLVARSYSPSSAKQRRFVINQFISEVGDDLSVQSCFAWWASIAHLADATRRSHLSGVRAFIAHLIAVGVIESDPTAAITPPRVHPAPPVVISPAQARAFLDSVTEPRVKVAVALMLGSGLRAGDVCALNVEDCNLDEQLLRVRGKGNKVRLVPIPDAVMPILRPFVEALDDGPLIRRDDCVGRMKPERLRARITHRLYRSGIKRAALDGRSSHVLRRTCATTLLEGGHATIADVQAVLGHASLSSTQRYLAESSAKRLRGVIEDGPLHAA